MTRGRGTSGGTPTRATRARVLVCALAGASAVALLGAASLLPSGCGAPPWRLGAPLDGRPSIPPGQARQSAEELHANAAAARAAGQTVLEFSALAGLDRLGRLTGDEQLRLIDLLTARAAVFHDLGRPIPESGSLEAIARLGSAARAANERSTRAAAATAAGDAWKAIGARSEARVAYSLAASLGGVPGGTVAPSPIDAGPASGSDAGVAADSPDGGVPGAAGPQAALPTSGERPAEPAPRAPPVVPAALPAALPAVVPAVVPAVLPPTEVSAWVLSGPVLSARLLPLVASRPWVLDDQPRALAWAELLLEEEPTSPDVLEMVALIFGRATRLGGTERMLMELTYYTPDRAAGLARGAAVWERLGRPREACAQWIRAARWRDDAEDPAWRKAVACTRRDPGAGDWKEIRAYVVSHARAERREAIAAELDAIAALEAAPPKIAPKSTAP